MEKEALPNTGLYDQRAVLQWIQDYIGLVGGDASSILHHITAFGGQQDPLFQKAIVQSPAYQFMFDRQGTVDDVFHQFANLSGCAGQGIDCLRAASTSTLATANTNLALAAVDGTFPVGPCPDGQWVRQIPTLDLASGNYWKNLDGLIISHTSNEATLFVDGHIETDAEFDAFLDSIFPPVALAAGVDTVVINQYPSPNAPNSPYATQTDRFTALIRDSCFTCAVRFLTDAYAGKTYNLQYSVTPGWHATDLLPTFYDASLDLSILGDSIEIPLIPIFGGFATAYQSYLTSFVRSGDPNTYRAIFDIPTTLPWSTADTSADALSGVIDAGDLGFSWITDQDTTASACRFWQDLQAAVTELGGYSPPGAVVPQGLVAITGNPSANYAT
jgi:carboxylesterase type B